MDNYDNAIAYIDTQEATKISYVKVGDNSKNLIVSFASNNHTGFERKTSLMNIKYNRNNFDVLYLRNQNKWYLGGLNGIGKNINCTIAFLRRHFAKYDKVMCVGNSAGGYASLLFGSLLKVNRVVAIDAQTDLQYCVDNLPDHHNGKQNLIKRSKECPTTWNKYNKIASVLNENVVYDVFYKGDGKCQTKGDLTIHGDYHYNQIKHSPNIHKLNSSKHTIPLIDKFLKE